MLAGGVKRSRRGHKRIGTASSIVHHVARMMRMLSVHIGQGRLQRHGWSHHRADNTNDLTEKQSHDHDDRESSERSFRNAIHHGQHYILNPPQSQVKGSRVTSTIRPPSNGIRHFHWCLVFRWPTPPTLVESFHSRDRKSCFKSPHGPLCNDAT